MSPIKPALCLLALASPAFAEGALSFELGLGVKQAPGYFGSSETETSPKVTFGLESLELGPFAVGGGEKRGLSPHGSFRFVGARKASDYPELTGLPDVDAAIELGFGLGYEAESYRLFADLRRGFGGHTGVVAELGGDVKLKPSDRLSVNFGPRATFASDAYFDSYFNVNDTTAGTSGMAPYDGGSGLVSTGAHVEARYQVSDDWAVVGTLNHELLRGGAADSPIVANGSARQTSASVTVNRRFTFAF